MKKEDSTDLKIACLYAGTSQRKDGVSIVKFKIPGSLLADYIQIPFTIGMRLGIAIEYEGVEKRTKLGWARYAGATINRENEATFKFEFMHLNMAGLNDLVERVVTLSLHPKADYGND